MTIKEKILTFLDKMGVKKADFFESLGIAPSNFKGAAKQTELGGDKIVRILTECPNLSAEWLMRDKGPMILNPTSDENENPRKNVIQEELSTPTLDRLLDKIDQRETEIGNLREEIGMLKARIKQLEEEAAKMNTPRYATQSTLETSPT